ncbi:MAG TPA: carbohydrate ABC transporter permease, partial [Ktedonobacteraceae bacterium]|nr:carbohydrate ABC transporter permease [Ktedonobacteraceae bacterium]
MSQTTSIARPAAKEQTIAKNRRPDRQIKFSGVIAMIFLGISTLYFVVPFLWLLISSTKNAGDLFGTFGLWFAPHFNLFANLQELFTYDNSVYLQWLLNSFIYAGIGSIIAMFLSSLAGYALAK